MCLRSFYNYKIIEDDFHPIIYPKLCEIIPKRQSIIANYMNKTIKETSYPDTIFLIFFGVFFLIVCDAFIIIVVKKISCSFKLIVNFF